MAENPTQGEQKPADSGSFTGALKGILGKFLQGVDDMLPAVVVAYDRTTNRATVRPTIRILKTDNTLMDRAQVASVPVLNIGGGNAVLSFNLTPGDIGWIKASDRDISLFLQSETDSAPNTLRQHEFSDAMFIPDQFRRWTTIPGDESSAVFQTLDGSQRVVLDDNLVRIESTNQIHLLADSAIVMDAPFLFMTGTVLASGPMTVGDDVTLSAGDISVDAGSVTASVDVVAGAISGNSHTHTGSPSAPTGAVTNTGGPL